MRFVTDDGRFCVLVTPLPGHDMFRFQLVIGGQAIGDTEPCILGSAMRKLRNLTELADPRSGSPAEHLTEVMPLLRSDQEVHDASTWSHAESLDPWLINAYTCQGNAVFLAIHHQADADSALISR